VPGNSEQVVCGVRATVMNVRSATAFRSDQKLLVGGHMVVSAMAHHEAVL